MTHKHNIEKGDARVRMVTALSREGKIVSINTLSSGIEALIKEDKWSSHMIYRLPKAHKTLMDQSTVRHLPSLFLRPVDSGLVKSGNVCGNHCQFVNGRSDCWKFIGK